LLSCFVSIFVMKIQINLLHKKLPSHPARADRKYGNPCNHNRKERIGFSICNGGKIRVRSIEVVSLEEND